MTERRLTRRSVLQRAGIAAGSVAAAAAFPRIGEAATSPPVSGVASHTSEALVPQQVVQAPAISEQQRSDKEEYAATVVQTYLFSAARVISAPIIQALGIPARSKVTEADMRVLARANLTEMFTGLAANASEDIVRWIASVLSDVVFSPREKSPRWELGIPVSALLALALGQEKHPEYIETGNFFKHVKESYFPQGRIPLYQFFGGLFYWYLLREKGFPHSVVSHSLDQMGMLALGRFFNKTFPHIDSKLAPLMDPAFTLATRENVINRVLHEQK